MENIDLQKYCNINLDVLIGGIPCQSFSQLGNRKGLHDSRGKLFFHFHEMVNVIKPKIFMLENVPGLVTLNNGETLEYIIKEFNKLNMYKIHYKILNSNNYSVAQNRNRLFIVGVNNNITKIFQFPKEHEYKPVLRDVLLNCPSSNGCQYKEEKMELFNIIPEGGC
jgi:DNA (cytosine-5)-methyltransferase 1